MKKILIYILGLFLLIASALALTVPESVEFVQTNAGQTTSPKSFIINSDAALTATISFSLTSYNVVFSKTESGTYTTSLTTNLAVGSNTVYVKATIPDEEESGTKTLGNIIVDDGTQYSVPLNVKIRGRLHIDDFDAKMGKETANNIEDGDKINKKLKPGDSFEFTIKVENTFPKGADDSDINNIFINVIVSGIDDGEDLEEESDEFDLNPDESHSETFKFKTPIEVEEGDYEVIVDVEGEDDNGVDRKASWTLTLEVEKESHDVKIYSASLSPVKIICGGTAVLSTTIYNFGRQEEDEVKLVIKNSGLGINIEEFPIELKNDLLEEESKYSKSFTVPVSKTQKPGTYSIEMWLYFNEDSLDDYRKLELVVEGCSVEEKKEEPVCGNSKVETGEECDDGNTINGDGCSSLCKKEIVKDEEKKEEETEEDKITGTVITETKEEGSPWIAVLIGVNVLVLIIVIAAVIFMFRKKPEQGEEQVYKNF